MSEIDTSSQRPAPDLSKPSRRLDAWVGERLMGWTSGAYDLYCKQEETYGVGRTGFDADCPSNIERSVGVVLPYYSSDIAAAWEMEAEIERRGLIEPYGYALEDLVGCRGGPAYNMWAAAHASPLQRCQAALKAVEGEATP